MTVSGINALVQVLDGMGLKHIIRSDTAADVYGTVDITELTLALAEKNCKVAAIQEQDETLENYYINLVGGDSHA